MSDHSFSIQTFGCKVNTYDTGLLQARLQAAGYISHGEKPRIHILNTCAVTQEATKEAVRQIRRLKARDPLCTVVVTGCAAQVDTDAFRNLPGADLVVANSHKGQLEDILKKFFRGELKERVFHSNIFRKADLEAGGGIEDHHTRAFLKIQDGCNSFCTYCVIPFARGRSRSIPIRDLVRRVNELYHSGAREVVLTGVHIGDYEDDSLKKLEDLIEALLTHTTVPRFRLSSLEPVEVTPRLLDLYSDSRMCPHFHMSIQSAQSTVLAKMRRHYDAKAVEFSLTEIARRVANSFVGMDVIVGFPQESDEEFQETYERLAALPWTRIHVFPYSTRPGTKAAALDGHLTPMKIHERAASLRALSSDRYSQQAIAQIGQTKEVLILNGRNATPTQGLTRDYWPVIFSSETHAAAHVLDTGERVMRVSGYDHSSKDRMNAPLLAIPLETAPLLR